MTVTGFQRARSPEAKARRRAAILDAAAVILDREGLEAVTLAAIAARAGVVKSNIYRYFQSREEILLRLLLADLAAATMELTSRLSAPTPLAEISRHLADAFVSRPRLCLLTAQMAPILEHNISAEVIREVKQAMLDNTAELIEALQVAAPQIPPAAARDLLLTLFSLVAGLWPMTNPPPQVAALVEEPRFQTFRKDFAESLRGAAHVMIVGFAAQAKQ